MFKPVRVVATIVFLGSIALVFVGAFVIGNEILCIGASLCLIIYSSTHNSMRPHSIRDNRISRIHMVHALVHPLRTVRRAQDGRHGVILLPIWLRV